MKIGELAKLTAVSRDTIRFYEDRGLLTEVTRPFEWNNYKDYGNDNIKRIKIIKYLQRFSFKLKEIKELLDQRDLSPNKCIDKSVIFKEKLEHIENEILNLQQTRDDLIQLVSQENDKVKDRNKNTN